MEADTALLPVSAGDSSDEDTRKSVVSARPPLWLVIFMYVATALLQPTLTDTIRYSGGAGHIGWPPTQLATLANTLAMASLMLFVSRSLVRTAFCSSGASLRRILTATALDLVSGCLLTTGLLILGGGIFVVIYSSTTIWTALWARCSGQRLSLGRWTGVVLVSGGMVVSASANFADAAGDAVARIVAGCVASGACGADATQLGTRLPTPLHPTHRPSWSVSRWFGAAAGTMLHAAMFVYSEIVIRHAGIDLIVLCASMGALETAALSAWNLALLTAYGPELYLPSATPASDGSDGNAGEAAGGGAVDGVHVALLYGGLTLVNALHAWAFFNMLERVGAVSSAVMKGVQMVRCRRPLP
jgi:drug/metabolite transporter (DMT)-like permease